MVQPSTPKQLLARLVTRQGGGEQARQRRKITPQEVADAVAVVRLRLSRWYDLKYPQQSRKACSIAMGSVLSPDRGIHPDDDWDLVAVYARLQSISRREACYELGLIPKPKPTGMLFPKQYAHFLRLFTTRGKGTKRRLKKIKQLDPQDVGKAVRLVQVAFPETDFVGNPTGSAMACHLCCKHALSLHDPPMQPHKIGKGELERDWDLVAVYMEIAGIDNRKQACSKLNLHAPLPEPDQDDDIIDMQHGGGDWGDDLY